MFLLTAAGDSRSRRAASAKLPSSTTCRNTFSAVSRSMIIHHGQIVYLWSQVLKQESHWITLRALVARNAADTRGDDDRHAPEHPGRPPGYADPGSDPRAIVHVGGTDVGGIAAADAHGAALCHRGYHAAASGLAYAGGATRAAWDCALHHLGILSGSVLRGDVLGRAPDECTLHGSALRQRALPGLLPRARVSGGAAQHEPPRDPCAWSRRRTGAGLGATRQGAWRIAAGRPRSSLLRRLHGPGVLFRAE